MNYTFHSVSCINDMNVITISIMLNFELVLYSLQEHEMFQLLHELI